MPLTSSTCNFCIEFSGFWKTKSILFYSPRGGGEHRGGEVQGGQVQSEPLPRMPTARGRSESEVDNS